MKTLAITTQINFTEHGSKVTTHTGTFFSITDNFDNDWVLNQLNRFTELEDFTEENTKITYNKPLITAVRVEYDIDKPFVIADLIQSQTRMTEYDLDLIRDNDATISKVFDLLKIADQAITICRDNQEIFIEDLKDCPDDLEHYNIQIFGHNLSIYID